MTATMDYSALTDADLSALVAERMPHISCTEGADRLTVEHIPAEDTGTGKPLAMWCDRYGYSHAFDITNPRDYMAVVEAMRERGWYFMMRMTVNTVCHFYMLGMEYRGEATDDNIGHAIAIAALMAEGG